MYTVYTLLTVYLVILFKLVYIYVHCVLYLQCKLYTCELYTKLLVLYHYYILYLFISEFMIMDANKETLDELQMLPKISREVGCKDIC